MAMHLVQAAWLDETIKKLEAFLYNEKNNPDERTIGDTQRKTLWRYRRRLIVLAAQIREDGKRSNE